MIRQLLMNEQVEFQFLFHLERCFNWTRKLPPKPGNFPHAPMVFQKASEQRWGNR